MKSRREIDLIREGGRLIREALERAREAIVPGARTGAVNEAIERYLLGHGVRLAFKGYVAKAGQPPFPAGSCISVNDEVVHGIPGERVLQEGDIASIDIGVERNGYYADAAATFPVGRIEESTRTLLQTTERALARGIEAARPGGRLSGICRVIQEEVESAGFSVVRQFVGHGVGASLHEEPAVPNFLSDDMLRNDVLLEPGLVIAIEPMVNVGRPEVRETRNRWTVRTRDGSLSAHFEHTVAVTETGPEVLTR